MKKLLIVLLILLSASVIYAQEQAITMSGEIKTGLFMYARGVDNLSLDEGAFIANSEDTNFADTKAIGDLSNSLGRFRLNFIVETENIGTKFRFETTRWPNPSSSTDTIFWGYAFAYGYFLDKQVKISAGKMGDSPWASGGPEMWKELDTTIGMRFEFIPSFIPFIKPGALNIGFVLNDFNAGIDGSMQAGLSYSTLGDILRESVFGLSYTHDYFHIRAAYRLDSEGDEDVGDKLVYRVEERAIQKILPGFQIFANGFIEGINGRYFSDGKILQSDVIMSTNWLYIEYAPEAFTAQLRIGYNSARGQGIFYTRAKFEYNFLNKLIVPGVAFEYAQDFGPNRLGSDEYLRFFVEPQIRMNFAGNTYIALVYRYQDDYHTWNLANTATLNARTHWINLRAVFTF